MERRLRDVPWGRVRTRRASRLRQHPEPRQDGLCEGQRHLHPVPFPRPAGRGPAGCGWPILRLARRLPRRPQPIGLLDAGAAQAGRADLHPLPRWHGTQEPHAGQRLHPKPDVCPRRRLFLLPPPARQLQPGDSCASRSPRSAPRAMPRAGATVRTPCRWKPTPTMRPAVRAANASLATCPRSSRRWPTSTCPAIPSTSSPPAQTDGLKIPNACNQCHKDKTTAWAADALKHWDDRSPWRMAN